MTEYYVRRNKDIPTSPSIILDSNKNLYTGEKDFIKYYGEITSLEQDLLLIGSSVFAADRATKRGDCEDLTRKISLSIPVVNSHRLLPLINDIEEILRILSNDSWRLILRPDQGDSEIDLNSSKNDGKTLLFSGGLDSLSAAVEFGTDSLQLVSHVTKNQHTTAAQRKLVEFLAQEGYSLPHYPFFASSRNDDQKDFDHSAESSQRTRSFLFLILGGLVARRSGNREVIFLAENGQMAIHLPLSHGRIGAFSTHTAHPDYIQTMQKFLSNVFEDSYTISNPYVHKTKAEVVNVLTKSFPEIIPISHSCWKNARLPSGYTHCGECIPCYIRRIAIEISHEDKTPYLKDPWAENLESMDAENVGRRNIVDLTEFVMRIYEYSPEDIMSEWPELYSDNINSTEVISMYKRFSNEAIDVLSRYKPLTPLLS